MIGPFANYPGINNSTSSPTTSSPTTISPTTSSPSGKLLGLKWWIWLIILVVLAAGGGFMFMSK